MIRAIKSVIMVKVNSFLYYTVNCVVLLVSVTVVHTADPGVRLTEAHKTKLSEHFTNYGVTCVSEYSISFEDVRALQSFQMPKGQDAPCFFACVLKRAELMDSHGKITPEAVLAVAKTVFQDEKDLNEAVQVFQACAYVNDRPVSDGNKGCERAMLALSCLMEQSKVESDAEAVGPDGTRPPPKQNPAKFLMSEIINQLLKVTCAGASTVAQVLPLRLISEFIPTETFVALCSLFKG